MKTRPDHAYLGSRGPSDPLEFCIPGQDARRKCVSYGEHKENLRHDTTTSNDQDRSTRITVQEKRTGFVVVRPEAPTRRTEEETVGVDWLTSAHLCAVVSL